MNYITTVYLDNKRIDPVEYSYRTQNDCKRIEMVCLFDKKEFPVLKIKCVTNKKTLNTFKFNQKILELVERDPVFEGFYEEDQKIIREFRLGNLELLNDRLTIEQQHKAKNQTNKMQIEITEWIENPIPPLTSATARFMNFNNMVVADGPSSRNNTQADETDYHAHAQPVGFETENVTACSYNWARGKKGKTLAIIDITFAFDVYPKVYNIA
nr:p22.2 [Cnaphalocrocis medinalis granulovirus]